MVRNRPEALTKNFVTTFLGDNCSDGFDGECNLIHAGV